ncbi:hypothetical protein [Nitrosospira sp. Is2]|uniref:hypothetical protein n=1 Tax=Nitrosospira sp. Is2 TaxID=3080532 RepID=UPI002952F899|nr:hypothetical protein [Nitrosospira sp. Is2]WON74183.1 hypothetical protein R5L00_01450 [Nitrosospira sp. Is2]
MKTTANTFDDTILAEMTPCDQAGSGSAYMVIDNFNTGTQAEIELPSGKAQTDFKNGSMLGGSRQIVFRVDQMPFGVPLGRKGVYTIDKGHLIVEDGVHMASRLEISYGIAKNNDVAPLNLDLSKVLANGQFTLHFHSLDMLNQVDVIIQVVTPSREIFQHSKPVTPPVVDRFDINFPLAGFRSGTTGKAPVEDDFKSIDYLTLIFQEGGNGGNDFAVDCFDITFIN